MLLVFQSLSAASISKSELQATENYPFNKVVKSDSKRFCCHRGVTRRQGMRYVTRNGIDQCQNGPSNLFTPYREHPRSTRIVVAYPRPVFSAAKRTNHASISFDRQTHILKTSKEITRSSSHTATPFTVQL